MNFLRRLIRWILSILDDKPAPPKAGSATVVYQGDN